MNFTRILLFWKISQLLLTKVIMMIINIRAADRHNKDLIEARDEFEDPEEDIRRIYVLKLFNGLQEWNYGLFVQEIFKLETKESLYLDFL